MAAPDMSIKQAAIELNRFAYERWLKAHGKPKRKDLTQKQEIELKECFELIDTGGSGRISIQDVPLAFSMLGMNVAKREIEDAVRQVCAHAKTIKFPMFRQVMLLKFEKLPVDEYEPSESGEPAIAAHTLPFGFLAQAYRRRKLIEAVIGGDRALRDRMNHRSQTALRERKALREGAQKPEKKQKESKAGEPVEVCNVCNQRFKVRSPFDARFSR